MCGSPLMLIPWVREPHMCPQATQEAQTDPGRSHPGGDHEDNMMLLPVFHVISIWLIVRRGKVVSNFHFCVTESCASFPWGYFHVDEINLVSLFLSTFLECPGGEAPPSLGTLFVLKPVGSPQVQAFPSEADNHQGPVLGRFCSIELIILRWIDGFVVEILEK